MKHHHEAFAELHPYTRHHHMAFVELRPALRYHHVREITSCSWGTTTNSHLEVHGISSNSWGTTVDSPLESPWNYVHMMRHHHEPLLQESWDYVLLIPCLCFINQSYNFHAYQSHANIDENDQLSKHISYKSHAKHINFRP